MYFTCFILQFYSAALQLRPRLGQQICHSTAENNLARREVFRLERDLSSTIRALTNLPNVRLEPITRLDGCSETHAEKFE